MLQEMENPRQDEKELPRRWFLDDEFDLLVWLDESGRATRFELIYDRYADPRAVTWKPGLPLAHHRVDEGENRPGRAKAAPMLVVDGVLDAESLAEKFALHARDLPPEITMAVLAALAEPGG
ncbi:MAG: hypothetical protein KKA60_13915 [Proteobacteria bacterium]|nr:hypothetical protein [Pseudomonadota bacterium]